MNLEQEHNDLTQLSLVLESSRMAVRQEKEELRASRIKVRHTLQAQELIQLVAQAVQQKAHERLATVVSSCLAAVFDDPYEFKIRFERKRGRTEAVLYFSRDGLEVDPMTAAGGGMIDVAAFALRVACLILHRPKLRQVLILDEPFKFVSAEYRSNVRDMLERMAGELKIQIIMITHIGEIATGKIIHI